jgi:hypothetical protein
MRFDSSGVRRVADQLSAAAELLDRAPPTMEGSTLCEIAADQLPQAGQ